MDFGRVEAVYDDMPNDIRAEVDKQLKGLPLELWDKSRERGLVSISEHSPSHSIEITVKEGIISWKGLNKINKRKYEVSLESMASMSSPYVMIMPLRGTPSLRSIRLLGNDYDQLKFKRL